MERMLDGETGTELWAMEDWDADGIRQGRNLVDSLQFNK